MSKLTAAGLRGALTALAMITARPALATTTTAEQFTQTVIGKLHDGDVTAARLLLRKLHALGVDKLSFGGKKVSVETLINDLRAGHPKPDLVIGKLTHTGAAIFVWCNAAAWASRINLAAPPPEVFPVSSSGAC